MKVIKYIMAANIVNAEEFPEVPITATIPYSEKNLMIAEREAYNGEYTIEDDGQPDPAEMPTQLDTIEAQVVYTAMMTDTLLEV